MIFATECLCTSILTFEPHPLNVAIDIGSINNVYCGRLTIHSQTI